MSKTTHLTHLKPGTQKVKIYIFSRTYNWLFFWLMLHFFLNSTVMQHQNRSDKIKENHIFGVAQSVDLAILKQWSSSCLQVWENCAIFLLHNTETYLSLRLIQGWVVPPNMGISVPISIWISSNVHTTLRANLWLDLGSGRFSSGLGSGNGGQALQKQNKKIQNTVT